MKKSYVLAFLLSFFTVTLSSSVLAGTYFVVAGSETAVFLVDPDEESVTRPSRVTGPIDLPRQDFLITITQTVYMNAKADAMTLKESDHAPICKNYGNGRAYYTGGFQKLNEPGTYRIPNSEEDYYKRYIKVNCTIYNKSNVWHEIYLTTASHYEALAQAGLASYSSSRWWSSRIKGYMEYLRYNLKAITHRSIADRYL